MDDSIDFLELLYKFFFKYWYLYILFGLISLFVADYFLKSIIPVYEINSTLLIQEDKHQGNSSEEELRKNLNLIGLSDNIANEIQVLSSYSLMEQTVMDLDLEVGFEFKQGMKVLPFYRDFPIQVDTFQLSSLVGNSEDYLKGKSLNFEVKPSGGQQFELLKGKELVGVYNFGETAQNQYGRFLFSRNTDTQPIPNAQMHVLFKSPTAVTNGYLKNLKIGFVNLESTILHLKLKDEIPQRGLDVLNHLIELYNTQTVNEKNAITENSLAFIDNRLLNVKQELTGIERNIENYKRANKISNEANTNVDIVLHDISKYTEEENVLEVQLGVMKSMMSFLRSPKKLELVPANLGVDNVILDESISTYNGLILAQQQLLQTAQPSNPLVIKNQKKIVSLQGVIRQTITNLSKDYQKKLTRIKGLNKGLAGKLNKVPTQERGLLEIRRQYEVKEGLYSFLLQKREETALSLITRMPNSRVIDAPRYKPTPVSPVKSLVYLGSLIVGLFFPFAFSIIKSLTQKKILTLKDIKILTDSPIIGVINRIKRNKQLVIIEDTNSVVAERFRLVRTNLQTPKNRHKQVIMVTSSMEGEGKTTVATNLAMCYAETKQKTIILDMNLRNPNLSRLLNNDNQALGITDFISGKTMLPSIIRQYGQHTHLHYILSGTLVANPYELLSDSNTSRLFFKLIDMYNIVIVDTPAIGLVTDAFTLNEYITDTVFVVREGMTTKSMISGVNEIFYQEKLSNGVILYNGAKTKKSKGISSDGFLGGSKIYNKQQEKNNRPLFQLRQRLKKII